jgi:hypothetical protein
MRKAYVQLLRATRPDRKLLPPQIGSENICGIFQDETFTVRMIPSKRVFVLIAITIVHEPFLWAIANSSNTQSLEPIVHETSLMTSCEIKSRWEGFNRLRRVPASMRIKSINRRILYF